MQMQTTGAGHVFTEVSNKSNNTGSEQNPWKFTCIVAKTWCYKQPPGAVMP